jgi:hypothetical protein
LIHCKTVAMGKHIGVQLGKGGWSNLIWLPGKSSYSENQGITWVLPGKSPSNLVY